MCQLCPSLANKLCHFHLSQRCSWSWFIPLNHEPRELRVIGQGKARQRASSAHCRPRVPVFTRAGLRMGPGQFPICASMMDEPFPQRPTSAQEDPILVFYFSSSEYTPSKTFFSYHAQLQTSPGSFLLGMFVRPLEDDLSAWAKAPQKLLGFHSGWRVAGGNCSSSRWSILCVPHRSHGRKTAPVDAVSLPRVWRALAFLFLLPFIFFSPSSFSLPLFFFFSFFLTPLPPFAASVLHPLFRLF